MRPGASRWIRISLVTACLCVAGPARAEQLWSDSGGRPVHAQTLPDFVDLAARLSPAVVNISTEQRSSSANVEFENPQSGGGMPGPFGEPLEQFGSGHPHSLGSGFIINRSGFILTNDHVVEDASSILVTLRDGRQYKARVIGRDSKTDIALIKIDAASVLPVAPLGDSDSVRVGAWVMAIGNPFGFDHTVTAGIVSAKGRFIPGSYDDFIQTDASINPGNSGGPLIDLNGTVVGVNSAIYTRTGSNMGIGFAIPVNLVKSEIPQLKSSGKVVRGWLGVYIQPVPADAATQAGLSGPHGAMVGEIIQKGPAAAAGLKRGDIIVEFDHRPVSDSQQLPLMVGNAAIGRKVMLTIMRNRVAKTVPIVIQPSGEDQLGRASEAGSGQPLGLKVADLDARMAQELGLVESSGVVVAAVEPGSTAAAAGVKPRDIILEVDRQAVKDRVSYEHALGTENGEDVVLLLIKRSGGTLFIPVHRQG